MDSKPTLTFGTCSWKYDSWKGLVYPESGVFDPLEHYSKHYQAVEVDQWFWSLFKNNKVKLPDPKLVQQYSEAVPPGFTFGIKVPNSITLTHYYTNNRQEPLLANPNFLSVELMKKFLGTLQSLDSDNTLLMFQFEYLNKKKMSGVSQFIEQFGNFCHQLPAGYNYCVESRNPNYLTKTYFEFLQQQNLHHVFLHGYYMPPAYKLFKQVKKHLTDTCIIRLHGSDRKGMEQLTRKNWHERVAPKEEELNQLAAMFHELQQLETTTFVFVNNHFEGSAPRTITRLEELMDSSLNRP